MLPSFARWARPFGVAPLLALLPLALPAAAVAGGGVCIAGCGGAQSGSDPNRPLSGYSGRLADLFDDTVEPAAVGLDLDKGYSPRLDRMLRERSQVADGVLRVRVSTVTAKTDGPEATFQLALHPVEKLAGNNAPTADFVVNVTKASASHGILKSLESRLVGYAFVAFVREFALPSGDREIHFHLAPDTKDVKAAVGDAVLMSELK